MNRIILKPKRDKSLQRRHPWVFSGAIARVEGNPEPGTTVDVVAADGHWRARGAWSPNSQIAVRVWSFDPDEIIDAAFFRGRIEQARQLRRLDPALRECTAWRWVNAEADGLPGLIVDRYADWLVCQFASCGAEHWRSTVVEALAGMGVWAGIYERSDLEVRGKEGLTPRQGVLQGPEPPERLEIREYAQRYRVDVRQGHKTGFYLDQRASRRALAAYCAGGEVLNAFSYTGAFTVVALQAGATRVTNIDSSASALALGREQLALNGLDGERVVDIEGNVFGELRRLRAEERRFDLIILDPPKFIESRARIERAARGYKDINLLACQLLRPSGILMTFSCSGLLEPELFRKIVADAALDAGREARVLESLQQAGDHPELLSFPESRYLKGLVCRIR